MWWYVYVDYAPLCYSRKHINPTPGGCFPFIYNMKTTHDFQLGRDGCLESLGARIERELDERHFCVVFEDEVERCWPKEKLEPMERDRQIQVFAKSRGWNAFIHNSDSGLTRAIFLPW